MLKYPWQLYHWNLELSAKCTLKCPRCPRNELDNISWLNQDISYEDFKNAFTEDFIRDNILRFTMCGTIGDPIYNKDFIPIIRYIKNTKPTCHIHVVTNGSHKKQVWWEEVATVLNEYDSINFSIDGYNNETNNIYRINSNFDSIINGMRTLAFNSKCFVGWAAIYFSFNQDNLTTIRQLARDNGCDYIQWTKSTKFGSTYGEAYDGVNDTLEPRREFISATHRYERIVESLTDRILPNIEYMNNNIVHFNNISSAFKEKPIIPLCLVGNRGMHLTGDGVLHPCSWTSFPYDSMAYKDKVMSFKDGFFSKNREKLSIKNHRLIDILNSDIWKDLFENWSNPNKTWVECSIKCNVGVVDYNYGVGYMAD